MFEFYFRVLVPTNLLKNNHISIVWHSMPCSTYYFARTKLNKENKFEAQILCSRIYSDLNTEVTDLLAVTAFNAASWKGLQYLTEV